MYMLYLDASGTPELQDSSKHFVLVGACIHETAWFSLDKRLRAIKRDYCLPGTDPDSFEIHVKQFNVSITEQDRITNFEQLTRPERRARVLVERKQKIDSETTGTAKEKRKAKYKDTDAFIHLTRKERSQLLEDAIDAIAGQEQIRLFGEAISKSHPAVLARTTVPIEQAFTQVVSRFDTFLQKMNHNPRRSIDHGLLMLDHDASTQSIVEPLFRRFREHGHPFGQMTHVIDVPFFGSSQKVSGLQVADVAAYVVRRYVDKGAVSSSHEERHFKKLFPRFDRDNGGRLHGLRHYVPSGTCKCLACHQRGHAPQV